MRQMIKKLAVVLSVVLVCAPMGAMAANKLIVKDAGGVNDVMVVTDTGALGVGTNAPVAAIEINGLPGIPNSRIVMRTIGKANTGGGGVLSLHNNDATASGTGFPVAGDRLGFYLFGTKNGPQNTTSSGLMAYAEDNWIAGTQYPAYLTFYTASTTAQTERMRITSSGNIGMGTNAPKQQLEVNGGIRLNTPATKPACSNVSGPTNDGGVLWFTQGAGTKDSLEVCAKDNAGNYAWRLLY